MYWALRGLYFLKEDPRRWNLVFAWRVVNAVIRTKQAIIFEERMDAKPRSNQQQFDRRPVNQAQLTLNCRDAMIPILRSLQYIYSRPTLREENLNLLALEVHHDSRHDRGREGLDYWQFLLESGCKRSAQ
jgi:hypothetical protein